MLEALTSESETPVVARRVRLVETKAELAAEIDHGRQGLSLLRLVSLLVRPLGQQVKSRLWSIVFG